MSPKQLLPLVLFFLYGSVVHAASDALILKNAQQHFSIVGTLERTREGFVYVKVSEEYINETLLFLGDEVIAPPAYYGVRKVGAHITAIKQDEAQHKKLFIPQIGQPVVFFAKRFAAKEINDSRYYYYLVEVPQVELIRLANGLPGKILGDDFHITVGIEPLP